jgi:Tol biopolymer transport system component
VPERRAIATRSFFQTADLLFSTLKQVGAAGAADGSSPFNPSLSPDGRRVAFDRIVNGNRDVWLIETTRGALTRMTFEAASDFFPVWSPDGAPSS